MPEFHVSLQGFDNQPGTPGRPLRTISRAAALARPGDTITVHAGVYRERVDPPRGGHSPERRITYRAAPGERVVITGSERMQSWIHAGGDVWTATLPAGYFGDDNPYAAILRGHWFFQRDHPVHAGAVYFEGHWLLEAARRDDVYAPVGAQPLWFGEVFDGVTTLHAQFPGADPNIAIVEINVRPTVFYPSREDIHFLTVRGFVLRHAATPWSPPTTEQIGLIGTHWGRGWIIEDNDIAYSACAGLTLGKYHDPEDHGDRDVVECTGEDTFHGTIRRALARGWSREHTGGHVVRRNRVAHCEMAGICGSLGAIFSEITDNEVHHIHVRRTFDGWEMAGIKFHAAIDTLVARNHVHHCHRGLWLDWMSQGTRVHANRFHDNGPASDLFLEVNHGPCVVDHNFLLSPFALQDWSEGTLFAHNLVAGRVEQQGEPRRTTPWHEPHSTTVTAYAPIRGGDNHFLNNLFFPPADLRAYDAPDLRPSRFAGNVYVGEAHPAATDPSAVRIPAARPGPPLPPLPLVPTSVVEGANLGLTAVSRLPYQDHDGSALRLDTDSQGQLHRLPSPAPGPYAATP